MDLQNLAYALAQVVHNFGAVAVVGGAVYGRARPDVAASGRFHVAWLVLVGWLAQAGSGLAFGAISYAYYRQLPDIHGIAVSALYVKIACAIVGSVLAVVVLLRYSRWPQARQTGIWSSQVVLGVIALTAAAFLRWFS